MDRVGGDLRHILGGYRGTLSSDDIDLEEQAMQGEHVGYPKCV